MGSKRQQTMAKMMRERAVQERRTRKLEKKDAKKQAALETRSAEAADGMPEAPEGTGIIHPEPPDVGLAASDLAAE